MLFKGWSLIKGRLMRYVRGDMAFALLRTFFARALAAIGSLILALVIGRIYGPGGMGVFALAQSILIGVAILARQGMQSALMRYVAQDPSSPAVSIYLRWALTRALFLSLIGFMAILLFSKGLEDFFSADGLAEVLIGIAIASPAFTVSFLFSGFFKGVRKPATAVLLENGSVALLAGFFILFWAMYNGEVALSAIGYSYAISAWLVAAQACHQVWCWKSERNHRAALISERVSRSAFMRTSRAFFFTNLANFMQSVLGIWVVGFVLGSTDLGLFKSSQQVSVLISFILIVMNAVLPPRFASLYHQGKMPELARLARGGAAIGALIAAPFLLICLFAPKWVLAWFGEGFDAGAPLLQVVAVAQLINVSTGSVGFLLNMTGYERLMRNIALLCSSVGLILFFLLPSFFGATGAAMAMAFVLIMQNIMAVFFVWRRLGIWTLPGPNLLRWIGVRADV